ncbi:MAG: RdgB/HAM1 family non-canonical purine NTP pyrophosphatase [Sphingobacteriales bacterium]|jgi:XTP/dITP diphosphohydrolase|nr:RdgB/HAM1 family non-canonical purine NTP pyrophosphatase [Sphingobacteriales bacterium]MBP9142499.1 RdgB/HAM1 family non-canonical purine NTP pyrophosphatase [Chitinophagales bacterium]MDA0199420.1 RdgB/HAM1 family non-canonical purine NTP pyrophosphatase [Bacteroidota bacterium]MBK6890648.1 RdgB/HAM1 family non-canonical purine NTP pyrophosphatase [Sphingobacteriales bacterium]MBK7526299.1 RdgB/HAM1 family non-canonical purine NTP pyrophosphatase [Sphingobacteriales bacterium]
MQLIFATHNKNKVHEAQIAAPPGIKIISLHDIGYLHNIPEPHDTLEANALEKLNTIWQQYGLPCFAEDAGLEVEALNNQPGVFTARYAALHGSSLANPLFLLEKMQGITNRKARFRAVVALVLNNNNPPVLFQGQVQGQITHQPIGNGGFAYDPVFIPDGHTRTFAQLTDSEKHAISHRGLAMRQLWSFLGKQPL